MILRKTDINNLIDRMHIYTTFVQHLRTETDTTADESGRKALIDLDDILYNTMLDLEKNHDVEVDWKVWGDLHTIRTY